MKKLLKSFLLSVFTAFLSIMLLAIPSQKTAASETKLAIAYEDQYKINRISIGQPQSVTNLKAVPYGKNKVLLTWNASYGANGYIIYAQKNRRYAYVGMTFGHYYLDSKALDADYNYYWVFPFAYNADRTMNVGTCSKYVYAKGIIPAVTGLKAESAYNGVRVSWNARPASEGVDGYLLYGKTGSGPYHYIGMRAGRTSTSYADAKVAYSQYNYYWVAPFHYGANKKVIPGVISSKYVYGKKVAATIQLNKTTATLSIPDNSTLQLKATVKGLSQKVTWASSNTSVATVSSSGKVTAKKEGTVTITARANGVSVRCTITIKQVTVELSDYIYDKSVSRVAAVIGGMSITRDKTYKNVARKDGLLIGILEDQYLPGDSSWVASYVYISDIINNGYTGVTLFDVKIGDTYFAVKEKLNKHYILPVKGDEYTFHAGNAGLLETEFRNGKLSSYWWKVRATSYSYVKD